MRCAVKKGKTWAGCMSATLSGKAGGALHLRPLHTRGSRREADGCRRATAGLVVDNSGNVLNGNNWRTGLGVPVPTRTSSVSFETPTERGGPYGNS